MAGSKGARNTSPTSPAASWYSPASTINASWIWPKRKSTSCCGTAGTTIFPSTAATCTSSLSIRTGRATSTPTTREKRMAVGAVGVAPARFGAAEIVDPRPYAVGTIAATYAKYPTTGQVLPAMGYSDGQVRELEQTINNPQADLVLTGTPIDLSQLMD